MQLKARAQTGDQKKAARGLLLVITGPSGVGKGTLLKGLLELVPRLKKSISVTTRVLRATEIEGFDYFFRSPEEFLTMVSNHEFMEWAEFAGNFYGTPKKWVEQQLAAGTDVILEIEVQGAKQVHEQHPEAILIFVSPPSFADLEKRLRGRGTETPDKLAMRLSKAKEELKEKIFFHYEVVNDNLEEAVNNLANIVYSERCKLKDVKKTGAKGL